MGIEKGAEKYADDEAKWSALHLRPHDRSSRGRVYRERVAEEAGVCRCRVLHVMRWQARKKSLRARMEEATRICREKSLREDFFKPLFDEEPPRSNFRLPCHNRRPYRDPNAQPVKWRKLIQWWLLHRVSIDAMIRPEIEAAACSRFKISPAAWEEAKRRFPRLLVKVNEKRLRRIEYVLETGKLPPTGWTPPDPKNRSTQNVRRYASFWKH